MSKTNINTKNMDTTIRILYAEDDADGAKLTKMILEKENFDISIDYQSEGTLRFIELMNVLYDLITGNHIYFLDELGNRMHYDLIVYYLMLFLYNSDSSQLFFTSQSVLLLDEDFIRRDAVYLTEKDIETASSSYKRVSDMGLHKNLSLYNAYRIGKLGSRPELGSPYLNV
jgi:AAA15 family ATPase/GTPase